MSRLAIRLLVAGLLLGIALPGHSQVPGRLISCSDYPSVQAAIDANPGGMVFVPPGDHLISTKVRIAEKGGGLYGFERIVQTDPAQTILEIEHAAGVRICDVTLTRAEGAREATAPGLFCWDSQDVTIDGAWVIGDRSPRFSVLC